MKLINEIGIAISPTKPQGLARVTRSDSHCAFVGLAREGRSFYARNEDISCPLARFNLGLEEMKGERLRELAGILVSWGDAESEEIAMEYLKSVITLDVGEKYICYFPMKDAKITPDVVVKVGSPDEFMPLIRTITRLTGRRTQGIASGVGGMCGECTAIPLMTGRANISLGCGGSRPKARLNPDQLLLALPISTYRLLSA